jgi:DNA polymerase
MDPGRQRIRFELLVHRRAGLRRWSTPVPRANAPIASPPAVVASAGTAAPALSRQLFAVAKSSGATREERLAAIAAIDAEIGACTRCKLCEKRTKVVPGEGALDPPILFIGEGPGADEDRTGRPFVGRAGQLLDKMIAAIGLERGQVYIANIVKCRPPENRTPEPDEVRACMPFLSRQIEAIRPTLLCTLGLPATRAFLPEVKAISAVRGRELQYGGLPLVPTFHPAYLLRNPAAKHEAWADLQLVARLIGRPVARQDGSRQDAREG